MRGSKSAVALALMAGSVSVAGHTEMASPSALQWYRGNTHAHAINSDGDSAPDVVARWYREHGYQFLFITDHEYVTDVAPLTALLGGSARFLVLPGQEVTQWSDDPARAAWRVNASMGAAAHVDALFAKQVIWPIGERRCTGGGCGANAPAAQALAGIFKTNMDVIRGQGSIAQINHPNLLWCSKPEDLVDTPDRTLIEI